MSEVPEPVPDQDTLRRASGRDTAAVLAQVVLPLLARGPIARRAGVVRLLARMDADRRAIRLLQRLRDRYGDDPLLLRVPVRDVALVLSPGDVDRVLHGSPDPFRPDNLEKRAALRQFQPHGVLISHGQGRARRRGFNEAVLAADQPVHPAAPELTAKVVQEAELLRDRALDTGRLTWDDYASAWWRAVRRLVLGEAARDDHELTDLLTSLRHSANWSYLRPQRRRARERFLHRLSAHLERAEPGSLAAVIAGVPAGPETVPHQQVPQWLFAFDAAGMAGIRALALLAAHPDHSARAWAELADGDPARGMQLPLLRASVLESLRLWPTTPAILRDAAAPTRWATGVLPAGAGLVIFAPFFHRDPSRLDFADRFAPEVWLDGPPADLALVPFSGGPARCPGRDLVLLTTSTMLAVLLDGCALRLDPRAGLSPGRLPGTYSPFDVAFEVIARAPLRAASGHRSRPRP